MKPSLTSYILFSCLAFSLTACSRKQPTPLSAAQETAKPATPPAMPSKEEMMAKWKEFATPGAEHEVLNALVGSWDSTMQFWMDPNGAPETSKGHSLIRWVMGKRFIEHTATGTSMGQPFEGRGVVGFDKAASEYRSFWFDNMGTGMMIARGSYDAEKKQIVETGLAPCPLQGTIRFKGVTTFIDPTHFRYEWYVTHPGATEMTKAMHIEYTKRGAKAAKSKPAKK